MKDLTETHLKKDKYGNPVVKPTKVEKTVDEDGNEHVVVTVPRIKMQSKNKKE